MEHSAAYLKLMDDIRNLVSFSYKNDGFRPIIIDLFNKDEENEIPVKLTEKQVIILNNYGIIQNYAADPSKQKKALSKSDIIAILSIILALIGLFHNFLSDAEQKQQTELQKQEVVEIQEAKEELTEIKSLLQSATSDEATEK